ncbi:MAG: CRISPR-associated endonuclease Cas2 [Acidobacteria bacterium]|nr:CRISPR-associated endonuclease Cas2 [Acidobacteriota bacterium]
MLVLVTYDVSTRTPEGRNRLSRVSKTCVGFGQRVQHSVFECDVDPAQFATLKARLLDVVDLKEDSLRFYLLGSNWKRRIEHLGVKPSVDMKGPLIA